MTKSSAPSPLQSPTPGLAVQVVQGRGRVKTGGKRDVGRGGPGRLRERAIIIVDRHCAVPRADEQIEGAIIRHVGQGRISTDGYLGDDRFPGGVHQRERVGVGIDHQQRGASAVMAMALLERFRGALGRL